jgi:phage N-6-adenine-methyltransferase
MSDTTPTPASESVAPKGPLSAPRPTPPPTATADELRARFDQRMIKLEGATDDGAWHRALEVARRLVTAGVWDGQRKIKFDAVLLHNRLFGVEQADPASLVEDTDYRFLEEPAPEHDPTIEHIQIGHAHFYLRYADLLPPLTAEEYDGLRASIQAHGIQQAIVVHRLTRTHIDVIDGAHRLRIAHDLGLDIAAIPLNFLMAATSEEDQRALAWSLNADRRHLSKEQRQQRAVALRQQGKSYRAIGEELGVSQVTARSDVQEAVVKNFTSDLPDTITTADGKTRPATQPKPAATLEVADVDTAREFIIDALRKKYSPLARGQLYRDAARIAGASGIKRAAFDAALDAMLEAGSVREHINHHGAREYHFADVVGRLERGAEQGGESAAPEEATPAPVQTSAPAPEPPAANGDMGVHYSSKSSEWYTPPDLLERVITVLGPIELDPCSNSHDAPNVPAQRHFTREDDGLAQSWASAALFMNPPYGSEIGPWVEKLAADYEEHHVGAAIALLPARTDTAWFRRLSAYPRCFIFGRLKFVSPESGEENPAPFPSMAVYLGPDAGAFQRAFAEIGDVFIRWDLRFRWGVGAETA